MRSNRVFYLIVAAVIGLAAFGVLAPREFGVLSPVLNAVLGAVLTYTLYRIQKSEERRSALEDQISERKRALYDQYVVWVRKLLANVKAGSPPSQHKKLADELADIGFRSMLVSSDAVMRRFLDTRNTQDSSHMMPILGDLLLEMRKDAGHPTTHLTGRDLLRVFVNDDAVGNLDEQYALWEKVKAQRRH